MWNTPQGDSTSGTRELGYPHPSSHQCRFRAAPGGSVPHQLGPATGEAEWALEARKQTLHRRNVCAGSGKSSQQGPRWEGPAGGANGICYPPAQQIPSAGGAWPSRSQLCARRGGKQVTLPRKKKIRWGWGWGNKFNEENMRELLMANGRTSLE